MNIANLSREVSEAYTLGSYTGYGGSSADLEAYVIKLKTIRVMAELLQLRAEYDLKQAHKIEAEKKEQQLRGENERLTQKIEAELK